MVRPTPFKIERTAGTDGKCSLAVTGELDIATTPTLQDEVNKALADGATTVDIDLANLSFIDSSGLRMFLQLNEYATAQGWGLLLTSPSEQVTAILRVTGSDKELPIVQEHQPS
jgi:anti-sigma B factor antagonist